MLIMNNDTLNIEKVIWISGVENEPAGFVVYLLEMDDGYLKIHHAAFLSKDDAKEFVDRVSSVITEE